MAKRSPIVTSRFKSKYDKLNSNTKAFIKFMSVILVLIGLGLVYHANTDQSMPSAQRLLERRENGSG